MEPTAETLIGKLPAYRDEWVMTHPDQDVKDIIHQVLDSHDEFAPYYDKIALYFDANTTEKICEKLYQFCKKNIRYKEETDKEQTTALPTGILVRGYGDCKHYSGFCAGILDALNRQGKKIKWNYRFASYKPFVKTPHHVFVVVNDNGNELWIDPTPGADKTDPVWQIDKKITAMPLYKNIAGLDNGTSFVGEDGELTIGRPYWQLRGAEGIKNADGVNRGSPYFSGRFLGLEHYQEDPYSIEGTDWNVTSDDLQAKSGIDWAPDFVKWVYENNLKFWNFYEPHGVTPGYVPNLPDWYPKLVITDDYRLAFDRDYKVDDFRNNEIQALTAWAQDLINQYDTTPFPLKTRDVKLFSQNNTGMPGNKAANLFNEHRGAGFIKDTLKWLEKTVNWVKGGVFKVVGSIPRNAFLGLVGINAFNMATNMWHKIESGQWDRMADKWKKLGGNPEKLRGTIEDGKSKKAILGEIEYNNTIGEPMTVGALMAAAAPIIAAMLAFIKDPDGKIHGVVKSVVNTLEKKYPDVDFSGYDFLDKETNQPIDIKVDPADDENKGGGNDHLPGTNPPGMLDNLLSNIKNNPLPYAAVGLAAFMLLRKKKKVSGTGSLLSLALMAYGVWELFLKKRMQHDTMPVEEMRQWLYQYKDKNAEWIEAVNNMTDQQVIENYKLLIKSS